ncbi:MAG TPA: HAMP domain-containing sensor histidine kinase, partial [Acidimicrobiia bacterium]
TRASGNADDLNRLVGQLLDFARIDADRVRLRPQVLTARAVVDAAVGSLAPALAEHRVEVEVAATLAVTADENAVSQILANLLTNAAKFSPAGTCIAISGRAADDEVVLSVSDDGPGVGPEDHDRVFERFYQAPQTAAARPGTGIGLTIAQRFTELQGGRIWVDRHGGSGATFSFSLPAAGAADRQLSEVTQR